MQETNKLIGDTGSLSQGYKNSKLWLRKTRYFFVELCEHCTGSTRGALDGAIVHARIVLLFM